MQKQFTSSFGSGFGFTLGALAAIAIAAALGYGWWQSNRVSTQPKPAPTVGTAEQAKSAALSALKKRGVRNLARECTATFDSVDSQWVVKGPAKTDDGKLIQVMVLLSVGTIDGTRHWKTEYMEVNGKEYLGK